MKQADGNRPILPGIVEVMAAVGGKRELDAERLGGVVERAQLISRRVREN